MPAFKTSNEPKATPVAVLRIGTHPIVYAVTVIIVAGVVTFFFAVTPSVKALQTGGKASIADARVKMQEAESKIGAQKKLVENAALVSQEDRKLLNFALPTEQDIPGLYIQISNILRTSGLRFSGMDVSEAPDDPNQKLVKGLNISVTLDNVTYDQVKLLMNNFENSLRMMDLHEISFTPSSHSASLSLRTYYLPSK
jgi:Tfp pilus assembly protein PilO